MQCSYCASEIKTDKEIVCSFCGHKMIPPFPEEGQRASRKMNPFLTVGDAEKPVKELETYHALDLLVLLRLVRKERSEAYSLVKTFNKAFDHEHNEDEYGEAADEAGKMYEYWTRRMWVLENVLMDRMGYFPTRISDELLVKIKEKCERSEKKRMIISRRRRE